MKGILCQCFAVLILSIPNFLTASSVTWTSYTEEILLSEDSPIGVALSKTQMGMVGSTMQLGGIAALLVSWQLPDIMGRKKSELLVGILMTLSWSLIATARSAIQLIAARIIAGCGIGLHFMLFAVYINEFSEPFIRGTMACSPLFFYSIGSLLSYLGGWFCSYNVIVYTNLMIGVVFTIAVNFIKESPVFLVSRGKETKALQSLKFYRGTSKTTPEVLEELQYLKRQRDPGFVADESATQTEKVKLNEEQTGNNKAVTEMSAINMIFTSKSSRRAFISMVALCILVNLIGFLPIQMYAGQIFKAAAPEISHHLCSVIMAVALSLGNGVAIIITDLLPRRVLMLSTGSVCAISLLVLSSLLRWSWAPVWAVPIPVLVYYFAFTAGAGNIPMVQLSESFAPKVKVLASAIYNILMFATNFVIISFYQYAVELLGLDVMFFIFFINTVGLVIVSFFIMKETKGIPLEDIQEMYDRGFLYWK